MTIEQEIKLQARYLAQDMAKNMAQDIAQSKVDESKLETAKNLLKINISPEQIATATGLSLEQVTSLKTDKN